MARRVRIAVSSLSPPLERLDSAEAVVAHIEAALEPIWYAQPDLLLLPECCDQPGPVQMPVYTAFHDEHGEAVRRWIAGVAAERRIHIAFASLASTDNGGWRNTVEIIDAAGDALGVYAKTHLTQAELDAGLVCGDGPVVCETRLGRLAPVICFDLNFRSLRDRVAAASPELILFPSMFHGGPLQSAWALDCNAHFAGAIRDQPSSILSPLGDTLATTTNYTPHAVHEINLDAAVVHLDYHREKLHKLKRDLGPAVRIDEPGRLGRVLIASESDDATIDELLEQYGIERARDYLSRYDHRD